MRNLINFGVTLSVIALLFLAFNLVWVLKLPNYRLDLSEKKSTPCHLRPTPCSRHLKPPWICIFSMGAIPAKVTP